MHIFTDNKASACAIVDVSVHVGQPHSLNGCHILHKWFKQHPLNSLHILYCPSHIGIQENELVDLLVRQTSNLTVHGMRLSQPILESLSYAKVCAAEVLHEGWAEEACTKPAAITHNTGPSKSPE